MAFRSAKEVNEKKHLSKFILPDDGDSAEVVFLYRNYDDVLIADTHYINSAEYSGYVQCCGRDCPACAKNIRVQNKLFIPLYNLDADEIQFWDRTPRFEQQLNREVFKNYPHPINYVFRITRKGEAGDINTKYSITAVKKYSVLTYDQILEKFNTKMPDAYELICRDYDADKLATVLNQGDSPSDDDLPDYSVTPRTSNNVTPVYDPVSADAILDTDIDNDIADGDVDDVNF